MKYLLDTNVLIEAKNGFYAFDLCPGFWAWLKMYQNMRSIQMVRNEIMNGGDFLSEWVSEELPADYFLAEDEAVQREYQKVAAYIVGLADFSEEKKDVFLD